MFGTKNKKLVEWFGRLPKDLQDKLEDLPPDEWASALFDALVEPKAMREPAAKDGEEGIDESVLEEIFDYLVTEGSLSDKVLKTTFHLDKKKTDAVLQALAQTGLITPQKQSQSSKQS